MIRYIAIFVLLVLSSCLNDKNQSLIDESERLTFEKYYNEQIKGGSGEEYLFYLILRDCECVEGNILFLKKILKDKSIKGKVVTVLIKTSIEGHYKEEVQEIKKLTKSVIIDDNHLFEKHGNIYATDKFFIIKNKKLIKKNDIQKNETKILNILS